ncbi:MAG: radical SAM family heme chaperone HemW [Syntrophomonadaceae bacterium]|nr:radical SAM family heme chaperone HemW [Syntrophomonadaceae bacterium]
MSEQRRTGQKKAEENQGRTLAVYLHIPFCLQKCLYCDFYSLPLGEQGTELITGFRTAVIQELRTYLNFFRSIRGERPRLVSLYFGGGTPTCLPAELLAGLIEQVLKEFGVKADGDEVSLEVTVEANPGTLDLKKLQALKAVGVNRLSIGAQTFDPGLLRRIGRRHTAGEVVEAVNLARQAGFQNLNLDLIYGLPGQTLETWQTTVEKALALGPEHLAAYSLKVEPGTPFYELQQRGKLALPGEEVEADMFEWLSERLAAAGYQHYEIANFARPGYPSLHNQVYWHNQEYLGLGPAAHSCLRGIQPTEVWGQTADPNLIREASHQLTTKLASGAPPGVKHETAPLFRFSNQANLQQYLQRVSQGQSPVDYLEAIGQQLERAETVFLGLRLLKGISRSEFAERFGVTVEEAYPGVIKKLKQRGLLQDEGERLALTSRAILIANEVFLEFLP